MALGIYIQSLSILCCVYMFVALLPSVYARVLFAWHPILMTFGYIGLMCEGISVAYRARITDGMQRAEVLTNHLWVQIASTTLVSLGFAAIYVNKNIQGKEHFTSLHGRLGFVTFVLTLSVLALGAISFKKLGLVNLFPSELHPSMKWLHRFIGITTWCLAIVVMQLDLPHAAVLQGITCRAWQASVIAVGAMVLYQLGYTAPTKNAVLPQIIDFTLVPRDNKVH